jgi:crossover junction endodeoxyribonuclease RuvC
MGVAIIEKESKEKLLYSNCLSTATGKSFAERLNSLRRELEKIIRDWSPQEAALEKLFFTSNQKTAMQVAEVRGMVLSLLTQEGLSCQEYTPNQIKAAVTGNGRADKKAVSAMLPLLVTNLKPIKYDDESDAIAVALTHLASRRSS